MPSTNKLVESGKNLETKASTSPLLGSMATFQGAAPFAEEALDHGLQLDVDRQVHGVARRGLGVGQGRNGPAARRGLDFFHARDAMQLFLALLDAELADVVGAPVVGEVVLSTLPSAAFRSELIRPM